MNSVPKIPRLRLEPDTYQKLCRRVLERDGWRCQACGAMTNLDVHHIQFRSHLGRHSEDNLITVCAQCHKLIHTALKQVRL